MKEIEIISTEAKEIAIRTKITLYCCVFWNTSGVLQTSAPCEDKSQVEKYAYQMSMYSEQTSIYKFEVDVPQLKSRK